MLAPLLHGTSAGELIPEIVLHVLQQLIELEDAAVFCAEGHQLSVALIGCRNGIRVMLLTTQVGDIVDDLL